MVRVWAAQVTARLVVGSVVVGGGGAAGLVAGVVVGVVVGVGGSAGCTLVDQYDECKVPGQCLVENSGLLCSDGQDNDQDGLTDCFDPSCFSFCDESKAGLCSDGRDNDLDGTTDCNDSSCSATADCVEQGVERCTDGQDNDLDGATDCDDDGCCGLEECHNADLCGDVLLDDDFSGGLEENGWWSLAADYGVLNSHNRVEVESDGVHIEAGTGAVWNHDVERGIGWPVPLDLAMGRISIRADLSVDTPPGVVGFPSVIVLTPHLGGSRTDFFVSAWSEARDGWDGGDGLLHVPSLLLRLWSTGHRDLVWCTQRDARGDQGQVVNVCPVVEPGRKGILPPHASEGPSGLDRIWHVRLDIDNKEVVLYERAEDGTWEELYRTDNLLPGRKFKLAFVSNIDQQGWLDQNGQHVLADSYQVTVVHRVRVLQERKVLPWKVAYAQDFAVDPGWQTNVSQNCHWDEEKKAMWVHWESFSDEWCYVDLPESWHGQFLRMEFSWFAKHLDWAAQFFPGLYDSWLSDRFSTRIIMGSGLRDNADHTGVQYAFQVVDCSHELPKDNSQREVLGNWVRGRLVYDPVHAVEQAEVYELGTDRLLQYWWVPDTLCGVEMPYFGMTSKDFRSYGAGIVGEGWIDEIEILYGPEIDAQ